MLTARMLTSLAVQVSLLAALVAGGAVLSACGSDAAPRAASPDQLDTDAQALPEGRLSAGETDQSHQERIQTERRERRARARVAEHEVSAAESMLPEGCGDEGEDCLPPEAWVDKLCGGVHPELALHMFRGGSPWKRLYSRAIAPAFNGSGGPSISDERVQKGEELIALRRNTDAKHSNAGEMSIGYTAGYDLLRWNGSCVTLHDGEFSSKTPRRRQHARVDWRALGDRVQSTLRADELISRAYVARRKECRGITVGNVTRKCVEQDKSLIKAVVDYVRAGGELPEPSESL
jgi:hypothetical protein